MVMDPERNPHPEGLILRTPEQKQKTKREKHVCAPPVKPMNLADALIGRLQQAEPVLPLGTIWMCTFCGKRYQVCNMVGGDIGWRRRYWRWPKHKHKRHPDWSACEGCGKFMSQYDWSPQ